jgi:hypothetical protein
MCEPGTVSRSRCSTWRRVRSRLPAAWRSRPAPCTRSAPRE